MLLGICFRFLHLDRKVYWHDEAFTSLSLSGHSVEEVIRQGSTAGPVPFAALGRFQRLDPRKSLVDVVRTLTVNEPHLPPLYWVLLWSWAHGLGDSVAAVRGLSAVFSLLTLPLLFWLGRELFGRRTAWVAVALVAISPFHVLYAQEARMYSLWALTTVLSSALLLRAVRRQTTAAWLAYAAAVFLGLYSHVLFAFVIVAHAVYALAPAGRAPARARDVGFPFLWATLAGAIPILPWLGNLVWRWRQATSLTGWTAKDHGLLTWTKEVMLNISLVCFDGRLADGAGYVAVPIAVLVGYALWKLPATSQPRAWWFVFAITGTPALALGLPDLLFGGQRFSVGRYAVPCWVGLPLALSHLLAESTRAEAKRRRIWRAVSLLVAAAGVVSCVASARAAAWWHKPIGRYNLEVARLIGDTEKPLVVSDRLGPLLSLSHTIDPRVNVLIIPRGHAAVIPDGFATVFVFYPFPELEAKLRRAYEFEPVHETARLWRLRRRYQAEQTGSGWFASHRPFDSVTGRSDEADQRR